MADLTRFPMLLLPYTMRSIAVPKELMIDYDTGVLYVRSEDGTRDIPIVGSGIDEDHLNDFDNPHRVTKKQIGLEFVENYGVATLEDIKNGVSDKYITPNVLLEYIEYIGGLKPVEKYKLTFVTDPDDAFVDVYLNNTWITDKNFELNPGTYAYRVYKTGYITKQDTVTITDKDISLNITLEKSTKTLIINTTPNDAIVEVYYNNVWNTGKVHTLSSGTYQYRIYKAGYKTIESTVNISTENVTLNITLEKSTYTATINTIPEDATVEVYYNNKWNKGKVHELPNGEYKYRAYIGEWKDYPEPEIPDIETFNVDITFNNINYSQVKVDILCKGSFFEPESVSNNIAKYKLPKDEFYLLMDINKDSIYDLIHVFNIESDTQMTIEPYKLIFNIDPLYDYYSISLTQLNAPHNNKIIYKSDTNNKEFYVNNNTSYKYEVIDKNDNILKSETITINGSDIIIDLQSPKQYTLTISSNVTDATIEVGKIKDYGEVDSWTIVTNNTPIIVEKDRNYRYIVYKDGYKTNCGVVTIDEINKIVNVNISTLEKFKYISISDVFFGAAIRIDGSLLSWNDNTNNRSDTPLGNNYKKVVVGNDTFLALTEDGTIVGWGVNRDILDNIPSGNGYKDISINSTFDNKAGAIKSDGSIVMWGEPINDDGSGIYTNIPTGQNFKSLYIGNTYAFALTETGVIYGWSGNNYHRSDVIDHIPSGSGYKKIAFINSSPIYALDSSGRIVAWDRYGAITKDIPTKTGYKDIAVVDSISASNYTLFAINSNNKLEIITDDEYCIENFNNTNMDKYNFLQIVGGLYSIVGLKDDNTIIVYKGGNEGKIPGNPENIKLFTSDTKFLSYSY